MLFTAKLCLNVYVKHTRFGYNALATVPTRSNKKHHMPKRFLRRYLPEHYKIKEHKHLRVFGNLLHSANLWHLNRHSVSRAFAFGLFCAFIPVPFQMLLAAGLAIIFSANLVLSVILVWISNPITIPPLFYFVYRIGAWVLNQPYKAIQFHLSIDWLSQQFSMIWQPLLIGSLICATASAVLGYWTIRLLWRVSVVISWRKRQKNRKIPP